MGDNDFGCGGVIVALFFAWFIVALGVWVLGIVAVIALFLGLLLLPSFIREFWDWTHGR